MKASWKPQTKNPVVSSRKLRSRAASASEAPRPRRTRPGAAGAGITRRPRPIANGTASSEVAPRTSSAVTQPISLIRTWV